MHLPDERVGKLSSEDTGRAPDLGRLVTNGREAVRMGRVGFGGAGHRG